MKKAVNMKFAVMFGTILTIILLYGAIIPSHASEPIKIGVYLPLTGQNAYGGQLELDGIKLAHDLNPVVLNRPVQLFIVDNKSDKVEAANAVKRLIDQDKVCVIIGSYGSSLSLAGGEVAEQAKIPVIGTSCTNPLVTQGKKYYFRACFIDPYQGAAVATYATKNLGVKKAATLTDVSSDYSVGLTAFFKKAFVHQGGEIVANLKYNAGDQDFTAQLMDLIAKKPDLVFVPSYFSEGAIIIKQAKELGATFILMGADAMDNPDTLEIGGQSINGFLHTTFPYDIHMPHMSQEATKFTQAWRKTFPYKDPNVNSALGYNCYNIVIDAIQRANSSNPEAITHALENTKNLPTALGILTINKHHDAEMPVGIIQYQNGKRVYLGEVTGE